MLVAAARRKAAPARAAREPARGPGGSDSMGGRIAMRSPPTAPARCRRDRGRGHGRAQTTRRGRRGRRSDSAPPLRRRSSARRRMNPAWRRRTLSGRLRSPVSPRPAAAAYFDCVSVTRLTRPSPRWHARRTNTRRRLTYDPGSAARARVACGRAGDRLLPMPGGGVWSDINPAAMTTTSRRCSREGARLGTDDVAVRARAENTGRAPSSLAAIKRIVDHRRRAAARGVVCQ